MPLRNPHHIIMLLDCSNLDHGARRFRGRFHYQKLAAEMPKGAHVKCFLIEDEYESTEHKRRNELQSMGFEVATKELKYYGDKASGNFDVEIALEMAEIAKRKTKPHIVILGSGDGDFIAGVKLLQQQNVEVWGLAFERSMSNELKKALDRYISIGRDFVSVPKTDHVHYRGAKWQT